VTRWRDAVVESASPVAAEEKLMDIGRVALIGALVSAVGMTFARRPDFETRERVRIQAHFDSVLGELRARDVSFLAPVQRANRARLVAVLAAYRDRGAFPHNYDRPGLVPTFVDPVTGVRCAVGHLIESTGRDDIVERVARANNHVLVAGLTADTAVIAWLDANGLTFAEASRIQVPYMRPAPEQEKSPKVYTHMGNAPVVALSAGAVGLTAWNLLRNRHGERWATSVAGIATGAVGVVAGNLMLSSGQASPAHARAAIWTGLASTVTGAVTMLPVFRGDPNHLQVNPTVAPSDGKSGTRVGLTAALRF
jgi:hypothetical protein